MSVVHSSLQPQGSKLPHLKVRPLVAIWALVVIILCLMLSIGTQHVASLNQQQAAAAGSLQVSTNPQVTPVIDTTPTSQSPVAASTQATVAASTCAPYAGSTAPSALSLADSPDGLTKQVDNPSVYQIYGTTPDNLRTQIRQCAARVADGEGSTFTAQTIYKLTWQYSYVSENGTCKVTHAKVGIHVMQIMPLWQPTAVAQTGLNSQWQSFMGSLKTHEAGHTALDVQHAQVLLNDLATFPATPCNQLAQSVKHLTDSDVATLNQANDNYDSTTNHGATQGAILP